MVQISPLFPVLTDAASVSPLDLILTKKQGRGSPLRASIPVPCVRRRLRHKGVRGSGRWPLATAHYSLSTVRNVFISSHPYFVPPPGETLSHALSSYGEEIPNRGRG